ncbi:MAG: hypothetical protein QGH20_01050 [Candidatus Latescibacteria bacterium]|nr:hypothetical protein [Candidatus Latescibacterota bacterium]
MKEFTDRLLESIEAIADVSWNGLPHQWMTAPPNPNAVHFTSFHVCYLGGVHSLLAKWTRESFHLDAAKKYALQPSPAGHFPADAFWMSINTLRSESALSEEEDMSICTAATPTAVGSLGFMSDRFGMRRFNHAITAANFCDIVARLWPDAPDARRLKDAADGIWEEWWLLGEELEGAPNYEGFKQASLLLWADRRGQREMALGHPGTAASIERNIDHVLPTGLLPGYGDSCSMEDWPEWPALFATVAAWTGNPRALWAAEAVYEWVSNHRWFDNLSLAERTDGEIDERLHSWWQMPRAAWFMSHAREALLSIDDNITPEPPPATPTVTHRTLPVVGFIPYHAEVLHQAAPSLYPVAPGPKIPDKVVLRLGSDAQSPSMMLSCARKMWHDHQDAGAIVAYSSKGALLLGDAGYMMRYVNYHNLFWAASSPQPWPTPDRRLGFANRRPSDYHLTELTGGRVAQLTAIACDAPHAIPMYHKRSVLLSRSGVMVVLDVTEPFVDGLYGAPLWHCETVYQRGSGWAEVSLDRFPGQDGCTIINDGVPVVIAAPDIDDDLKLTEQDFPDHPDVPCDAKQQQKSWYNSFTTRTCISWPTPLSQSAPNEFTTVLMPSDVSGSAPQPIETLTKTKRSCVVRTPAGLVVTNRTGELVIGEWGATDAEWLWADDGGVFAHHVKKISLPGMVVESPYGWIDVDVIYGENGVSGTASSEREALVTLRCGGKDTSVTVRGITQFNTGS